MRTRILLLLVLVLVCINGVTQTQKAQINLRVKEVSLTKWNSKEGIQYKQVQGANIGATSFEVMKSNRIAFLCNSSREIITFDTNRKKIVKKFSLSYDPRDFVFSGESFFVLTEKKVIKYDLEGEILNEFHIPNNYLGVERLTRFNNSTYLLLPSGNSLMIESDRQSILSDEREGWITNNGNFVSTQLFGNNSYSIKVKTSDEKIFEKKFNADKKVAGAYVVGSRNGKIVIDLQTFICENPISVERSIVFIELNNDGLGAIISNTKMPDCYYVLSNKDLSLLEDGTLFNMISSPQGLYIFTLTETTSLKFQGYSPSLKRTKYHFSNHLIQIDKN